MNIKLYFKLYEKIEEWYDDCTMNDVWEEEDFYLPENFVYMLTKSASLTYDAIKETSKNVEEEMSE